MPAATSLPLRSTFVAVTAETALPAVTRFSRPAAVPVVLVVREGLAEEVGR